MSIAGGVDKAIERGQRIGCQTMQIFTKNANQWKARPLPADVIARFKAGLAESGIGPVAAHDSYLINLGTPDDVLWRKSVDALTEELERCEQLDIPGLVLHPGAHLGSGAEAGVRRVAQALDEAGRRLPGYRAQPWLETTAGQGSVLGSRFEELQAIIGAVREPERVGVCLDTAHVFAAGYELRTPDGYAATWESFGRLLGLDRLRCVHVNDSKKGLGSRVDRHEHIGRGALGLEAFRLLVNDVNLRGRPMILETPKGEDMAEDVENLRILRGLVE
jgi:deoxyribonuclease-4